MKNLINYWFKKIWKVKNFYLNKIKILKINIYKFYKNSLFLLIKIINLKKLWFSIIELIT